MIHQNQKLVWELGFPYFSSCSDLSQDEVDRLRKALEEARR